MLLEGALVSPVIHLVWAFGRLVPVVFGTVVEVPFVSGVAIHPCHFDTTMVSVDVSVMVLQDVPNVPPTSSCIYEFGRDWD